MPNAFIERKLHLIFRRKLMGVGYTVPWVRTQIHSKILLALTRGQIRRITREQCITSQFYVQLDIPLDLNNLIVSSLKVFMAEWLQHKIEDLRRICFPGFESLGLKNKWRHYTL